MHSYRCFARRRKLFRKCRNYRAFSTPCLLCMGMISRFLFGGRLARARALLLPDQMHRAGAARRVRGKLPRRFVVRRRRRERRLVARALSRRDVVQDRREPALGLADAHALARSIILDLIALDLADSEIIALGTSEIEPRHRRAR